MASPKNGVAYVFDVSLTLNGSLVSNPALASGDVKLSTDEGAFANITTLPSVTPTSGVNIKVSASSSEMTGDRVVVTFIDQTSPKAWDDIHVFIETTAVTVDDLVRSTTPANKLDVNATGEAGLDLDNTSGTLAAAQIASNAFTAAKFATGALDGKGDWNIGKTGYLISGTKTTLDALNDIAATAIVSAGAITTLSGAVVNVDTLDTLTGHTAQTGDIYARLGAPAGASVSDDLLAIDNFVDGIETTLGTPSDFGSGTSTVSANLQDLADDGTAVYDRTTDSLQAVRDRGDAAWTTGAGGSDRLLMVDTTIATLASQTSFTLTAGSADDDSYNNCTIIIEDVSTSTQKAVEVITAYVGSTKTITLRQAMAFTIAATDKVYILAENSIKSTVTNKQISVTTGGQVGINWADIAGQNAFTLLSGTTISKATNLTNLPSIPANWLTSTGITASALNGKGDWNIGKTGYTLSSTGLDAITQSATGMVEMSKAVWDRVISKANHNVAGSSGKALRQMTDLSQIDGSISDTTPSITNFDTNLTQADGYFDNVLMVFSNGSANAGIGRYVSAYLNASGNITFLASMAWPVTPVNGDDFVIYAVHAHPISEIQSGLATSAAQTTAQNDLDKLTGTDGATLATAQGNYAPAKAGDNMGSVSSVTGNVDGSVGSLGAQAKLDVNVEVDTALATTTYAEPGQGTPGATVSLSEKISYLYKAFRNKSTQTSTVYSLYNDDTSTVDHKTTVSSDGTTSTKNEMTTGP